MRTVRTISLFMLLACLLIMLAWLMRESDTHHGPVDMVSGATPNAPPEMKTFSLSIPEATRVAAEVVALTVLRGGPQYLRLSGDDSVGVLYRNTYDRWTAADKEYGFGTPTMQWLADGVAPNADNASAALAVVLARRVASLLLTGGESSTDAISDAEALPLWCELRQTMHPAESFTKCLLGTLRDNDADFVRANACAIAIVSRNQEQIEALARDYARQISISQYDTFDILTYSGTLPRQKFAVCDDHHCGAPVHVATFKAHPLDMLQKQRNGLPGFCVPRPPVEYRSALRGRGESSFGPVASKRSGTEAFAAMASRIIVSDYLLRWDTDVIARWPEEIELFNGTVSSFTLGGSLDVPESTISALRDERESLRFVARYAALLGEGELSRGRTLGSPASRYETDRRFCNYALRTALGDAAHRIFSGRLQVLWQGRCDNWAAGQSHILIPGTARVVNAALHRIERCASAINKLNDAQAHALAALLHSKLVHDAELKGIRAPSYSAGLSVKDVDEVFATRKPVLPAACARLP